ncbi:hypothetical protein H8S11_13120 [Flintibacter sp. NSJ-23]|uniref:Uncharacterized protein n=1 Tax=Flintibacter hominis TaxID=2763048 RepID=A0A8J6M7A8_9FIRM|nr:hypothetical protein [Flintibacter hominis]MBC5723744.1 hypothetical protein [Flintibacter hominis]
MMCWTGRSVYSPRDTGDCADPVHQHPSGLGNGPQRKLLYLRCGDNPGAGHGYQTVQGLSQSYLEVADWPAVCVLYHRSGRDMPFGVENAIEFDLEIMNRAGDRFLDLPGIRWRIGPYEFYCEPGLDQNTPQAIEEAKMPGPHRAMLRGGTRNAGDRDYPLL